MSSALFSSEFKDEPYWWDRTPRPASGTLALPERVDVAIIGSGYTGLSAALQTARAGRETVVLDAEDAGWGCSSRNGGQVAGGIKHSYAELKSKYGGQKALAIQEEGRRALQWVGEFIEQENIDCDYKVCGRFHAAHTPRHYEELAEFIANHPAEFKIDAHVVPREDQHSELGTDAYFGGAVFPKHASIDPARYHQGLLERAQAAGAAVVPQTRVEAVERDGSGFRLVTTRGPLLAHDVIVATNGYTGNITPWQKRRVIPIGSYMIATEPLDRGVMDRLMPRDRIASDTRKVIYYYRASPDRTRVLFGGRVSAGETDPRSSGPKLHAAMAGIFPELAETKISHSWVGFVAYTFDENAHLGRHDGIYYAMGYCGVGAALAGYMGMRVGQQLLGDSEGATAFDDLTFQTRPFYTGKPWFLGAAVAFYRWRDSAGR